MSKDYDDLLVSAFPRSVWSLIVRAQREGVALADDARKNIDFLDNALGLDLSGHLRRIGVLWRFNNLCKTGDLPFTAEIERMRFGSWHWLNLRAGSFVAHVARTDTSVDIPDETPNRQHYLVRNDGDLFSGGKIVPISDLVKLVDRFYAYFTFGAAPNGKLTHSVLGMVSADAKEWLGWHDLLKSAGEELPKPGPAPKADLTDKIKFTEEMREFLRDQENSRDADKDKK